jgi:selenocysteine-specific elongation factor
MIVVGTAGHIDHGKSSIVKRLTGTDPDRLPEEKARGMTIDLGFAFYRTPSGEDIAFVDVPGHERFVKNMIAGAGGIDVAMLVVAADDGWMPQSQEHFQVVRLLGIQTGFVVINKIDLVEPDWLELLEQEIREKVDDSFLAEAPIFGVSAETGEGFEALGQHLNRLPEQVAKRRDIGKARLYIDRSFVRPGAGGVVTGTLRGGTFSVGQPVSVWPSMAVGKIRSLQSKSEDVPRAGPGQRTAVSFTGIDKELLVRGGAVSDRPDLTFFKDHPVLALALELLQESPVSLANRRRVLVIIGTTEMEGEIRLYNQKKLGPGGKGIVFFSPDEPVYTLVGDRFVIRLPTPMVTLGGGRVLDHLPHLPRQKQMGSYRYLESRQSGQLDGIIVSELEKKVIAPEAGLLRDADISEAEIKSALDGLLRQELLGRFQHFVYHPDTLDRALAALTDTVDRYLAAKPHILGLSVEELMRLSGRDQQTTDAMLRYLIAAGRMTKAGDKYNLAGRGIDLKGAVKEAHDQIMKALKDQPHAPPTLTQLAERGKPHREAIRFIIESGEGYKCGSDFIFPANVWDEIVGFIRQQLRRNSKLAVADLRDRFGFTRKFAIPILEETDRIRLTRREGDFRVKGDRFEG